MLMAVIAVVAFLVAASPLAGPEGLTPGTAHQFIVKIAMGAVLAGALLAPLVLDAPDTPHRILGNTTMVTLGRWSYGLFIWHLAALWMVFPIIGEFAFNGHMPVVLVLTVVFGFAIAAVSYALVESPCRVALRRWEYRRSSPDEPAPPLDWGHLPAEGKGDAVRISICQKGFRAPRAEGGQPQRAIRVRRLDRDRGAQRLGGDGGLSAVGRCLAVPHRGDHGDRRRCDPGDDRGHDGAGGVLRDTHPDRVDHHDRVLSAFTDEPSCAR